MRSIKLTQIYKNAKKDTYEIPIYWNGRQSFTNLVIAKSKLVEITKKYNKVLSHLNEIYSQALAHIQRNAFDFNSSIARKINQLIQGINERLNFLLNAKNLENISITSTILFIGLQIHELISLALMHLPKIKYTGVCTALEILATGIHDLLFKFRIEYKIENFEPQLFIREYETKIIHLTA